MKKSFFTFCVAIIATFAFSQDTLKQHEATKIFVYNEGMKPEYVNLSMADKVMLAKKQKADGKTSINTINFMVGGKVIKTINIGESKIAAYTKKDQEGKIFNVVKNKIYNYYISENKRWVVINTELREDFARLTEDITEDDYAILERGNIVSLYDSLGKKMWEKQFPDNAGAGHMNENGNYIYLAAEDPKGVEGDVKNARYVISQKGEVLWRYPEKGFAPIQGFASSPNGQYYCMKLEYPKKTILYNIKNKKMHEIDQHIIIPNGNSNDWRVLIKKDNKSAEYDTLDIKDLLGE